MRSFVADFESTTNKENCFVWAYALCEVGYTDNLTYGTTIDDFMQWCERQKDNLKIYFCNLKWDSQFILAWLFRNGFTHVKDPRERETRTFTTLISDRGLYYCIEIVFKRKGKTINKVTFLDSTKLLPMGVEKIAAAFKMPYSKGKIDYDSHNNLPPGTPLTLKEIDYITRDVVIVATGLNYFFEQGLTKMTIGANALYDYRKTISSDAFNKWFPTPTYHNEVKQSYKGGFTWLYPKFAGKTIKNGIVLDNNSMYPAMMKSCMLPCSTPIAFKGKYEPDKIYPLYIQQLRCQFELKPGKIPTIQVKKTLFHSSTEYLTSSNYEQLPLTLTNVDLELFFENYEIYNIEYIGGWKFKASCGLFDSYIDKWNNAKIQAKKDKNYGLFIVAKQMLNALYGKFGTDIKRRSKVPYYKDGIVKYYDTEPEYRPGIYIAMASFITSWARYTMVKAFQTLLDDYNTGKSKAIPIYCDTDSLHIYLNGETIESFFEKCTLEINNEKLGAFKFESKFTKARYLRSKCYLQNSTEDVYNPDPDYQKKVTVAGMPEQCYDQVNFDNFKIGATYTGKKQPQIVKGGVILVDVDFTINA